MRGIVPIASMAPKGKPSSGDESSGNRRGNPLATYRPPASAEEDDGGYPETVMFPPPARGQQDQRKRPPRGGSGGQEEEYPTTMAFPPPMAEPADDGEYPETVMYPPQKPKAGWPPVDDDGGYPETVMYPPQQRGRPPVDDDGGYPETVMYPPQQPGGGYPETVMFPRRQPGGQVDDGYHETVQYPPQRPGGQQNDRRQSRPPPPPPPFQPETMEFPPRGPVPQRNDRRQNAGKVPTSQPETVSWPPQPQPHFRPPPPRPTTPAIAPGNPWNSQLFDCWQDSNNAVMTAICPCVTFGQIAEIVDQGQTTCVLGGFMYGLLMSILLCSLVGATYRARLRQMYNLNEAPGEEWILHIFCPHCALCQEYRELYSRGLDPSIGWAGLAAGQGQQINHAQMTPPKMPPPMRR